MLQEIRDYVKCSARNKYTFSGFALGGLGCLAGYFGYKTGDQIPLAQSILFISPSFILLGASNFGTDTYRAYTRMREHIKEHGTIKSQFKDKFSSLYCSQTGIKIAAEEVGLEDLV